MKIDRQDKKSTPPPLTLVTGTAAEGDPPVRGEGVAPAPVLRALPQDQLLVTEALQEALDAATGALRGGDAVVLVEGEPGAGKTTFMRRLVRQLETEAEICYIEAHLALGERHILARVAELFACPPTGSAGELASLLARQSAERGPLLIAVDNADRLSRFALRALFDVKRKVAQGGGRLGLIISATPDGLGGTLALPAFSQFGADFLHRIALPRFSEQETGDWLRHLIESAGVPESAGFDTSQVRRIHKAARGLPRQIRRVAEDVLNGRKPRPWRSHRDREAARRRNHRFAAAGIAVTFLAGIGWLAVGLFTGPPRLEIAFDLPVNGEAAPAVPALSMALAGVTETPREAREEPVSTQQPAAAPSAPASASAPVTAPARPAASAAAGNDTELSGRAWLMVQAPDRYTVQVASSPDRTLAEQFIDKNPMNGKSTVIATRRGDRTLYLVVHGSFEGPGEARAAIAGLPQQVRRNDPFARTMSSLQAIATGR